MVTLVALENCLDHLKQLKQAETAILGIEGFVLENGKRMPNIGAIADFSSLHSADWPVILRKSHVGAENFISPMIVEKSCDAFEFVVSERADHTRD